MQDMPLVCTLTAADYRDRETAWLKLKPFVTGSAPIPGGLSFSFARVSGLQDSLAELVRLEAECCPWMRFSIAASVNAVELTITSNATDGEHGVREAFAPLARG